MRCWLLLAAACSSSTPKDERHVDRAPPVIPPAPADAAPPGAPGDVQIRVEWHDVPVMARASPGKGACGTPRAAAVAPTTTWGIPDAIVALDVARSKPAADPAARVVLEHCALAPRALIAGTTLAVISDAEAPAHLGFAQRGTLRELGTTTIEATSEVLLPIAGHEVAIPLEAGSIYELIADDNEAWIASAPNSYAAVTDGNGVAVLRDVPAGKHAVTAWLPGRSNQSRMLAHGEVTVVAGALAEVTLDLAK